MKMKFKDICNQTENKNNKQISFNLKKKKLKKIGFTPEQLMEITIPKSQFNLKLKQTKFGKEA